MLDSANNCSSDFEPVDTVVQFLVHQTNHNYIVPSDQVKPMCDLARRFWIIWWTYNALCGLRENLKYFSIWLEEVKLG